MFLAVCCLLGTFAFAQSGKGSLSGRVADKADAVLQGAQVELLPRAGTVTTDAQGEFNFTNLAPGTYTVMISYVGFEPFTQEVTITAGKNTQLRALINISGKNEEVTVLSERQSGEVEAINRTRAAENILEVLPAEVITSLPNANIADALGRMPGVTIERDEGEGKYVQILHRAAPEQRHGGRHHDSLAGDRSAPDQVGHHRQRLGGVGGDQQDATGQHRRRRDRRIGEPAYQNRKRAADL